TKRRADIARVEGDRVAAEQHGDRRGVAAVDQRRAVVVAAAVEGDQVAAYRDAAATRVDGQRAGLPGTAVELEDHAFDVDGTGEGGRERTRSTDDGKACAALRGFAVLDRQVADRDGAVSVRA